MTKTILETFMEQTALHMKYSAATKEESYYSSLLVIKEDYDNRGLRKLIDELSVAGEQQIIDDISELMGDQELLGTGSMVSYTPEKIVKAIQ